MSLTLLTIERVFEDPATFPRLWVVLGVLRSRREQYLNGIFLCLGP